MAAGDITPFTASYGGACKTSRLPQNTTAAFLRGEPVQIEAAGTIIEAATAGDPTAEPSGAAGIALASAADVRQLATGNPASTDTRMLAPVAEFAPDQEFITRNLFSGSDALVVPALANIGDKGGLRLTAGGAWGIDIGGTAQFEIKRVLDSFKRDVRLSGGTGVFITFARCEE